MVTLDFSQIRIHDGSQQNGFEELVCQLAHLEPPKKSDYFVRKEGAGGDAGVECYWKLEDGTEIAWQAKYFIDSLTNTQWNQISESVEAFLEKHPDVITYYVCIPRDWTDSRKKGKGGKLVKSSWDKWVQHKKSWEEKAKKLGRQVEFLYWGKHEISQRLQRRDPIYSGRAEYWFNTPILTQEQFLSLSEKSRNNLGERYDEENNINLPISEYFNSIALTKNWNKTTRAKLKMWMKSCINNSDKIINEANYSAKQVDISIIEEIKCIRSKFDEILEISVDKILKDTKKYIQNVKQLQSAITALKQIFLLNRGQRFYQTFLNSIRPFENSIYKIIDFLDSKIFSLSKSRFGIVSGDAGVGKSHLLCDSVIERINKNLPTIFLLGQHYIGGEPIKWIKESINMSHVENDVFLSALDSAGEACQSNALIVIDAINEGTNRLEWYNHLINFISGIKKYPNLSLIISCRRSYINYLIPDDLPDKSNALILHEGFKGSELKIANKYMSKYGLSMPNIPILAPEFSNPLFLKICCKSLKDQGANVFPKDLKGIVKLFNFYVRNIEVIISRIKRYNPLEGIVNKALSEFANQLFPDKLYGMLISDARLIFDSIDPNTSSGESLFNLLIDESIISEDVSFINNQYQPIIRFTYERFSDYFIAENICTKLNDENINEAFIKNGILFYLLADGKNNYDNILSAISIIIAEKFGIELVDLIEKDKLTYSLFDNIFTDTLIWRTSLSFNSRTLHWLNRIKNSGFRSPLTDIILNFSIDQDHPWNAFFLHKKLKNMPLPERDAFWTTHINISDYKDESEQSTSIIHQLIDWGYVNNLEQVNEPQIKLYCITLIWLTSSTNRKLRDRATKSAIKALITQPQISEFLLNEFIEINDMYIVERLYAIIYGVVTSINDKAIIKTIADHTYEYIFSKKHVLPHILIRDHASGIMEYAFQLGLLNENYDPEEHRPPFKSRWPLDDPDMDYFESDEIKPSSIKRSIMGLIGDFGKYSMGRIHDWSTSPIGSKPSTKLDLLNEFIKKINADAQTIIVNYIEYKTEHEMLVNLSDHELEEIVTLDIETWTENAKDQEVEGVDSWLENKINNDSKDLFHEEFSFKYLKGKLENKISKKQIEELRWIHGLGSLDSIASYSRKKAHRWVCKRAFDLGWSNELFKKYEQQHCISNPNRSTSKIERIGKKYQRIAYHEFLAHLSDNCSYIDPGYDDVDYSKFHGAWQLHERNIDPTILIRKTKDTDWHENKKPCWWLKYEHQFTGNNLEEKNSWLWDTDNIPSFENIVSFNHPINDTQFFMLRGFSKWRKDSDKKELPYQEIWFRVNSAIIKVEDFDKLNNIVEKYNLRNPDILAPDSSGHQSFFMEFPWHQSYKDHRDWKDQFNFRIKQNIKHFVPTSIYEWESGSNDFSIDDSISIYTPSKSIVNLLGLKHDPINLGYWLNKNQDLVFLDPSVSELGPSVGLIDQKLILDILKQNNYKLVWFIGGEKQMFSKNSNEFHGRLIFNSILSLSEEGIEETKWYERSFPNN